MQRTDVDGEDGKLRRRNTATVNETKEKGKTDDTHDTKVEDRQELVSQQSYLW